MLDLVGGQHLILKNWGIGKIKSQILKINSFISYNGADKIIVTTKEIKDFIIKKYFVSEYKIKIVPNGISTKNFKKNSSIKYKNRAICISRLEKQKNFELIDICKLCNLNLDLVGHGSEKKRLETYAKDNKANIKFRFN